MLLIYLPSASSRTEYIFDTIFNHEYGLSFRVTSDVNYFLNYQEEKINYSNKRFQNELYIHATYLLAENCIEPKSISVGKKNNCFDVGAGLCAGQHGMGAEARRSYE